MAELHGAGIDQGDCGVVIDGIGDHRAQVRKTVGQGLPLHVPHGDVGQAFFNAGFVDSTLSNFAAGVMLILLRPIKVGDFVEVGGVSGSVKEVAIFATTLLTGDNKTIILANSAVMGGTIVNYSTTGERRVDLVVGVGYSSNIQQVKDELQAIAAADDRVLKEKDVTIGVVELADSSVNLVFRPWVKSGDYWGVYFDFQERVYNRFNELGIEIPFPQMDVHTDQAA